VSEVPISSPYRSTPDAPVTEAERNQLSARLNSAFEAGALPAEEFSARLDRLFAAQRMGELLPVVQGLPPLPTHTSPAIVATTANSEPGQVSIARNGNQLALVTVGVLAGVVALIAILLAILLL
jgi:hypothetical protein